MGSTTRMISGSAWTRRGAGIVAAVAILGAASVTAAVALDGVIYVGSTEVESFQAVGVALHRQLAAYEVGQATSDTEVMRQVRGNVRNVGFVQRDMFVERVRQSPGEFDRLEFYGNVPACMVVVAKKDSPIRSYEDLVASRDRPLTVDLGPIGGRTALTFDMLKKMDPALGNLRVENRGGARALSRAVGGEIDAALVVSYGPFRDPSLDTLIEADAADLVPFVSKTIAAAALRDGAPYSLRQIELGERSWFKPGREYHTTCTMLGVVVNEKADIRLSEAVAQAMLQSDRSDGREFSVGDVRDLLVAALGRVGLWIGGLGRAAATWALGTAG